MNRFNIEISKEFLSNLSKSSGEDKFEMIVLSTLLKASVGGQDGVIFHTCSPAEKEYVKNLAKASGLTYEERELVIPIWKDDIYVSWYK